VLIDGAQPPAATDLPADIAALARCQYRQLRHRDTAPDLARIVKDCITALGGNATGPPAPDQARTPRARPGHETATGKIPGPLRPPALAVCPILGSCAAAIVPVVAVVPFCRADTPPRAPPPSPASTESSPPPRPGPPPTSSPHTEPPTPLSSPQPTRTPPP